MGGYAKQKKLGKVLCAPISVFLGEYSAPQPDLLFVATSRLEIIEKMGVVGTPDLVVEIVSPGSVVRDRVHEKEIYEQAGVPEYWVVDPKYFSVEVYEHTDAGYTLFQEAEGEGTVKSKVIEGLEISAQDIFSE